MTLNPMLQLLFALAFIAALCMLAYKFCCKCLDTMFQSNRSLKYSCFFITVLFFAGGVVAYQDFTKSSRPELNWFFPLFFLCSAIFAYLGTRKLDVSRLSETIITAEFSKQSADCLLKILKIEKMRLENFVNEEDQCDLEIVNDLINKLKKLKSYETTFGFLEVAFIISSLGHELEKEDKPSLTKEEQVL